MIVVVGHPIYRDSEAGGLVDGLAARIALASAARGRSVQFVGKAGDDAAGDAVVLALTRGGVGHAALLRDAGRPTPRAASPEVDEADAIDAVAQPPTAAIEDEHEPPPSNAFDPAAPGAAFDSADVELALRYLTEFSVLVLAEPATPDVVRVISAAAGWTEARLIVLTPAGQGVPDGLPPDAVVLEAPAADPDGVFATMVGSFAAALDAGGVLSEAFRSSIESSGWTPMPAE